MDDHLNGATTTDRLLASGLGHKAIRTKVRRGELVRVRRALYLHSAAASSSQQTAAIGILAVKERAVVTGACAVRWHGIKVPGVHGVDLVIEEGKATPEELDGVGYRHSSYLHHLRTVSRYGLPVAELPWAVGDLGRDLHDRHLAQVIARAVGMGALTLDALHAHLVLRPKFPGSARLRRVLDQLTDDMAFSGTEKRAARLLRAAGMPFVLNHPMLGADGRLIRPGDLVLPHIRLDLEVDGPHHWMPEQAAIDRRKDTQLREIDWVVERVAVYDINDAPETFVLWTKRLVARVTAMRGVPTSHI